MGNSETDRERRIMMEKEIKVTVRIPIDEKFCCSDETPECKFLDGENNFCNLFLEDLFYNENKNLTLKCEKCLFYD